MNNNFFNILSHSPFLPLPRQFVRWQFHFNDNFQHESIPNYSINSLAVKC